jgi:hypothetical protein
MNDSIVLGTPMEITRQVTLYLSSRKDFPLPFAEGTFRQVRKYMVGRDH